MMGRWLLLVLTMFSTLTWAEGHLTTPEQRGAFYFSHYCSGCHSLNFLDSKRVSQELALPPQSVRDWWQLADESKLNSVVPSAISQQWLQVEPPDLSLYALQHGKGAVADFLQSFYRDSSQRFGFNNQLKNGTNMPNVLVSLQGEQQRGVNGNLLIDKAGSMTHDAFVAMTEDIETFLRYSAQPEKIERENIGFWVVIFMLIFTLLVWLLCKDYWRDVQ